MKESLSKLYWVVMACAFVACSDGKITSLSQSTSFGPGSDDDATGKGIQSPSPSEPPLEPTPSPTVPPVLPTDHPPVDPDPDPDPDPESEGGVVAASDQEVEAFLISQCASCHKPDVGIGSAFWSFSKESWTEDLVKPAESAKVYQSILNKVSEFPANKPPAMPPPPVELSDEGKQQAIAVLAWFVANANDVVKQAESVYGRTEISDQINPQLEGSCQLPSTRLYMTRLFQSALSRSPTSSEFLDFEADTSLVADVRRQELIALEVGAGRLKSEFLDKGLRAIAASIGGGSSIEDLDLTNAASYTFDKILSKDERAALGFIDPENPKNDPNKDSNKAVRDAFKEGFKRNIRSEFYQKLRLSYSSKPALQVLMDQQVMVTNKTARAYENCGDLAGLPDDQWASCQLDAKRKNFFGTLGFLLSKPSSFLAENNNFGRVSRMYFVLNGEAFKANTNAPASPDGVPDLPACLEDEDTRFFGAAPRGNASIPQFSATCQSCHVDKYLAAGAAIFRPFSWEGFDYRQMHFPGNQVTANVLLDMPAADGRYMQALAGNHWTFKRNQETFVQLSCVEDTVVDSAPGQVKHEPGDGPSDANCRINFEFVEHLLNREVQACHTKTDNNGVTTHVPVTDLGGLADEMIPSSQAFYTAMLSHINRALINVGIVSLQQQTALKNLLEDNPNPSFQSLLEIHFKNEYYTCE